MAAAAVVEDLDPLEGRLASFILIGEAVAVGVQGQVLKSTRAKRRHLWVDELIAKETPQIVPALWAQARRPALHSQPCLGTLKLLRDSGQTPV